MGSNLLSAENIYKSYQQGSSELEILKGVNLDIKVGDAIGIVGSSGSGKSTLLQILGTLDKPNSGELIYQEKNLFDLSDEEVSLFRNQTMGFVFQFHHLLRELTAIENVLLPCRIANQNMIKAANYAKEILNMLGLGDRMDHYPNQLSGGELQRAAIARALIRHPKIIFADEPTGNLDSINSRKIQELFFLIREQLKITLVVVTHDLHFAQKFPRVMHLKDGNWN
ncbi:MAG: ABC transporter ATP-binding protein [Deltaproteobacteria bacterium]|nr:ABC transporter ATP-binding protein [Deltaproteobacteria bacterium]